MIGMERGESSERGAGRGGEKGWLEEWKIHTRLLRSALQAGAPDEEMQKLLAACFSQYSDYVKRRASSSSSSSAVRTAGTQTPQLSSNRRDFSLSSSELSVNCFRAQSSQAVWSELN